MNPKIKRLREIAEELQQMFPCCKNVYLYLQEDGCVSVGFHGIPSYAAGTELLREMGIGKRNKHIYPDKVPWTSLMGHPDGDPKISVTAYCTGLPPSCRLETIMKKVPKKDTVDTGEFIEVPETVVVCGQEVEA